MNFMQRGEEKFEEASLGGYRLTFTVD